MTRFPSWNGFGLSWGCIRDVARTQAPEFDNPLWIMASEHTPSSDLLPFGTAPSAADGLSPDVRRVGLRIYRQAWDAYREAGCPYGETDEAMLVWYSFQGEDGPSYPSIGKN